MTPLPPGWFLVYRERNQLHYRPAVALKSYQPRRYEKAVVGAITDDLELRRGMLVYFGEEKFREVQTSFGTLKPKLPQDYYP